MLARTWQTHDRELAIKDELVQQMTSATSNLSAAIQAYEFRPDSGTRRAYVTAFGKWDTESQGVAAKIRTYFADESLAREWAQHSEIMLDWYNLADLHGTLQPQLRREALDRLWAYVGRKKRLGDSLDRRPSNVKADARYQLEWRRLKYSLFERRDEIQRRIIRADMRL
jgi:hypothetical protein